MHANFSFTRVPMNGADFSRADYALAHSLDLSDFCLRDDRAPTCGVDYKLDVLKMLQALNPELKAVKDTRREDISDPDRKRPAPCTLRRCSSLYPIHPRPRSLAGVRVIVVGIARFQAPAIQV